MKPSLQLFALLSLFVSVAVSDESAKRYDGFAVLRAYPESAAAVSYVRSLEAVEPGCELWSAPRAVGAPVDVMVPPGAVRGRVEERLAEARIRYELMIGDVQALIDDERRGRERAAAGDNGRALNLEQFNGYDVIMEWLDQMAGDYPHLATVDTLSGQTYEGRTMKLIKIGTNPANPAVWLDGGIHAREWLSPATVIWFINKLLTEYATSSDIKTLVDSVNWYILPVHNPDGYQYSRDRERLWRKTRSPTDAWSIFGGTCYGVDPNRNWDNNWGTSGISHNGCSDIYCGKRAESEPCVKMVADYILSKADEIQLYITFHSYSQMWLLPYSWTTSRCRDYEELMSHAGEAVRALGAVYGTRYTYGQIPDLLYTASGGSIDWAYDTAGIKYSYGVELRDTGRYGFVPPASEIRPSGVETWEAVESLVNNIILSGRYLQ